MNELKPKMKSVGPSEELRVAVTFPGPGGGPGPTKRGVRLTIENIEDFVPKERVMRKAIKKLEHLGFTLTEQGHLSVSMKCTKEVFEEAFDIKLKTKKIQFPLRGKNAFYKIYYPSKIKVENWKPILDGLIDDVYIQWPHFSPKFSLGGARKATATPPKVKYYHLAVPKGIASLLKANKVHCAGITGKGIRVVMIDSGFEHHSHPFFRNHKYLSEVVLAGDAQDIEKDASGHGTGESANVFSVAPRVNFVGVKIGGDTVEDVFKARPATLLEGFCKARQQEPDIISLSVGNDLRYEKSKKQRTHLPNSLKALEAEILHAVYSGITVIAAAGNGDFSFPAMMPDVIAAGGVFVKGKKEKLLQASDLASAYDSKIYSGRHVPDICGLVGKKLKPPKKYLDDNSENLEHYIMLPVPPGCAFDFGLSYVYRDRTDPDDGWAPFSGTSAAAPQIAGVCALLKKKNPRLTPSEIKAILRDNAIKVRKGNSNPRSSDDGKTPQRGVRATGAGLVDAFKAWKSCR